MPRSRIFNIEHTRLSDTDNISLIYPFFVSLDLARSRDLHSKHAEFKAASIFFSRPTTPLTDNFTLEMHLLPCKRRATLLLGSHRVSIYRVTTLTLSRERGCGTRWEKKKKKSPEETSGGRNGKKSRRTKLSVVFLDDVTSACEGRSLPPFPLPSVSDGSVDGHDAPHSLAGQLQRISPRPRTNRAISQKTWSHRLCGVVFARFLPINFHDGLLFRSIEYVPVSGPTISRDRNSHEKKTWCTIKIQKSRNRSP